MYGTALYPIDILLEEPEFIRLAELIANGEFDDGFFFSVRMALQKVFLKSPCLRWCLCSMAIPVIWRKDEYNITGKKSFFSQYLSPWLPRTTI